MNRIPEISLLIATKNRLSSLKRTIEKSEWLIKNPLVETIICDDGSSDGTHEYLKSIKHNIKILRNERSRGIHFSRNLLLNNTKSSYAISLDDDTSFINEFEINQLISYFEINQNCSVIAFKIIWSTANELRYQPKNQVFPVKSFGAGASAINIAHWRNIPDLPVWFQFYGEEDIISLNFLRVGKYVHFNDNFIVQHHVNLSDRKRNKRDYYRRLRLSLRAGWMIYLMFFPPRRALKSISYSIYSQFSRKVMRGELYVLIILCLCLVDVLIFSRQTFGYMKTLNNETLIEYDNLREPVLY